MKRAFKIPLQSEVEMYMKSKMGWPEKFCQHYADKFWNHYQASGWKLKGGNAIKDWQACFNSQWKQIKYKEDQELLNSMMPRNAPKLNGHANTEIDKLDRFIDEYRNRPTGKRFEEFGQFYELMKKERLLKPMTEADVFQLRQVYGQDNQKCRCAVVMDTLSGYVTNGLKVKDIIKMREKC